MVDDLHSTVNRASDELDRADGVIDRAERYRHRRRGVEARASSVCPGRDSSHAGARRAGRAGRPPPGPDAVRVRSRPRHPPVDPTRRTPMKHPLGGGRVYRRLGTSLHAEAGQEDRRTGRSGAGSPTSPIAVAERRARPVMRWSTFAMANEGLTAMRAEKADLLAEFGGDEALHTGPARRMGRPGRATQSSTRHGPAATESGLPAEGRR